MKTKKEIRAAFEIMDKWFSCSASGRKSEVIINQIRGSHAMLAWILGIEVPNSVSLERNLDVLVEETDAEAVIQ